MNGTVSIHRAAIAGSSFRRFRRRQVALLAAVASCVSVPAVAQTSVPSAKAEAPPLNEQAEQLGADIIVTASKREERLSDVPQSITAVSGESLVEKGIYDIRDLVRIVPGLSFVEAGRSQPVFSIRGIGFFDTSLGARPTVSVYVDEAPLPFSVEAKGASFDLERVEVLKGPQGTLFGQNSTGGAINYIAAKPTSTLEAGGTASFGRFNTLDAQAFVSGPLSSTVNARFAIRSVVSDDYQESYTRDDSLGAQRFTQARLLLDWRPSDRLTVRFNANGFYDRSDTQAAQFQRFIPTTPARAPLIPGMATFPASPRDPRAADWDPGVDYRVNNKFFQVALRADYELSDAATITSLSTYSEGDFRQRIDADGTIFSNFDALVTGELSTLSEELRIAGTVGAVDYIIGGLYERDRTRQNDVDDLSYSTTAFAVAPPPAPPLDVFLVRNRQDFDTKAVFGNIDFRILDGVTLRGGIRYTQADLDYAACTAAFSVNSARAFTILTNVVRGRLGLAPFPAIQPGQCGSLDAAATPVLSTGTFNQDNISWRAGVDYKPASGTLLYFNVSKGYKAGSVQTSTSNSNLQYVPTTQESVLAYEAGVKSSLLNRKVDVTGAVFYYDYTDKQVLGRQIFQPNIFGPLATLINVPKSRAQGVELQVSARPTRQLSLTVAGTYIDTEVTNSFRNFSILGNAVDFEGDRFPYTPKWQLVADGEYRIPVQGDRSLFVGGNANYRSATTSGFGGEELLRIPGYTLIDLRAGIRGPGDRWSVQAYGRNVTNKYYFTNVARSQDSLRTYAGLPATYGVQLSVRY